MKTTFFLDKKINIEKPIFISISKLKGIGTKRSKFICKKLGFQPRMRFADLNASDQELLKNYLLTNFTIGTKLTNKVSENINFLVDNGLYRGRRHKLGYPVRGQRTLSNGKTQKKLSRGRLRLLNSNPTTFTLFKSKTLNKSLSS